MSTRYLTVDTVTGAKGAAVAPGLPTVVNFTSTGQTVFGLGTTILSTYYIKAYVDGRLQQEGSSYAWTRNTSTNSVVFTETVPSGKWVCVEIYVG